MAASVCKDHLGKPFTSKKEMCDYWGIPTAVYFGRAKLGWPLEKILTTKVMTPQEAGNSKQVTDHTGHTFPSVSEMCKHWGMTRSTYNARIKQGWSTKDALTKPQKKLNVASQECIDHNGIHYPSLAKMCAAHNISRYTYSTRIDKLGWSVEKALTTPLVVNSITVTDLDGNKFPSLADFAHYYNVPAYFVQGKSNNMDIPKLIQYGIMHNLKLPDNIRIKQKLEYPYFKVIMDNHELILSANQIMDIYHNNDFHPLPDRKVKLKHFAIKKALSFPNYEIEKDGQILIWSYWDIINYCHDNNFGIQKEKE